MTKVSDGTKGSILGKSPQDPDVLAVAGGQEPEWVRSVRDLGTIKVDSATSPQGELPTNEGADPTGDGGTTPLRQPAMREPGSPLPGNAPGQHEGREPEGPVVWQEAVLDPLQEGAPAIGGQRVPGETGALEAAELSRVPKVQAPQARAGLSTTPTGLMTLQSIPDQLAFARRLIEQRMVSSTFKTESQLVVAIQWAISMKLDPVSALRHVYVVNGRPCLWGDGPLMLVQRTGLIEMIDEFYVDASGKRICFENQNLNEPVFASVTRIKRKNDSAIQEDFFTLDDLARAGLSGKNDVWKKWARVMLRYKARSMAIKSKFADLMNGIDIAEYHEHFTPTMPEDSVELGKTNVKSLINSQLKEDMA